MLPVKNVPLTKEQPNLVYPVTAVKLRLERLSQPILPGCVGQKRTLTLFTALAGTYTQLNCPINAMYGQLFVIANKTAACDRAAEVNGTNTSYFFSESKQNWIIKWA
jgi:hypothetical protein